MKKIVFDMNPLGSFSLSCEAYYKYYKKKFNRDIYFYTRTKNNSYIRVDELEEICKLKNRVITLKDLGKEVEEIPFDDDIRACPIDESYENDEILKSIVKELGKKASWRESDIQIVEIEDSL